MSSTHTVTAPTADLEVQLERAWSARRPWAMTSRDGRARVLEAIAADLDGAADELVPLAQEESHLAEARLAGELSRTTFQLRLFAEVLREGGYLDVRVDHADPGWGMGPRPDIRRQLIPLGPVLVFAASNFPFAFSVAGGDTASALAAGCPVLVKAHPGHPRLSERTAELVASAAERAGAPAGVFDVFFGLDEGRSAVVDPRVKACGFTGSITGGRALFDLAVGRPAPIPFYGELGSLNPAFVTPAAAEARPKEIVEGFIGSFTLGAGQFCTKPGVLLVPAGSELPGLLDEASLPDPAPLLNDRTLQQYAEAVGDLLRHEGVEPSRLAAAGIADPPAPSLFFVTAQGFLADLADLSRERFGPTALVVTYDDPAEVVAVACALDGQLTATVHGEAVDLVAAELVTELTDLAGRVLWNQWPTGVTVSYAQQHGGPYPATTAVGSTSVGTGAISRFLRPVAYQNLPQDLLPADLLDDAVDLPRRVDGRLLLPEES
jgi:NADP-dependent aldehyde dehydrogenase